MWYLVGEMALLLILAMLLGLFVGWLLWGRRAKRVSTSPEIRHARQTPTRADPSRHGDNDRRSGGNHQRSGDSTVVLGGDGGFSAAKQRIDDVDEIPGT